MPSCFKWALRPEEGIFEINQPTQYVVWLDRQRFTKYIETVNSLYHYLQLSSDLGSN